MILDLSYDQWVAAEGGSKGCVGISTGEGHCTQVIWPGSSEVINFI